MRGTAVIETDIRPVVTALNAIPGVRSLWSCHGHPLLRPANPFVTFIAPVGFAFALQQAVECQDGLRYCWQMQGRFMDDGVVQYTLSPNDVRLPAGRRHWLVFWWRRNIRRELLALADLVGRTAASTRSRGR